MSILDSGIIHFAKVYTKSHGPISLFHHDNWRSPGTGGRSYNLVSQHLFHLLLLYIPDYRILSSKW